MDGQELSGIICIALMVMASVKALEISEACFIPLPIQICSRHRLQCASGENIQINKTFYVAKSDSLHCPDITLNCTSDIYPNCCKLTRGDQDFHNFNNTDRERIKTQCSNKRNCEFPAPRTPSLIFSVVEYECIQGEAPRTATAVGIVVAVVVISGILIVILCYFKRRSKQSSHPNRTGLNSALAPLYHEVMDAQPFPRQTASYEYAPLEDINEGPDLKPVVAGYDHLGVVSGGIDAHGLGVHYDTAIPVSQQERADDERTREGSVLYNHLSVKPQKAKVLDNHYDIAKQKPNQ